MGRVLAGAALVVVLLLVALLVFGTVIWQRLHEPFKGYTAAEQFVDIPPGTTVTQIGQRLVEAGIVRDRLTFRVALMRSGRAELLKAGEYRFERPLSVVDVIERLAHGDVYVRRLTFPEGLTVREMAALYQEKGFGASRDFLAAASNVSLIADLDRKATDLEGYLFPETYQLSRRVTAGALVEQMVARFKAVFAPELAQLADAQQLSPREVVTLAALVEKETGQSDERPLVAAVYRNRMRRGMLMQADPTVIYGLVKAGRYDGNIRRADLRHDSPYNTYRYPGLPPGPIAAPGRASLEAALKPADVPYLYFVSRNDGTHAFATSLGEHNRNVRQYQLRPSANRAR